MKPWHLVVREIAYRKLDFGLGVLAAAVAVGCLMGALTLLRCHDLRTEAIIAAKQKQTDEEMKKLQDDYRKITLKLGFNVLILPKDQNLSDLFAEDFAQKLMPESYVQRLVNAKVMTVAHVLPVLQQKVRWPEQQRTILLTGTRGEVPVPGVPEKKPLLEKVKPGSVVLGYELHKGLGLKPGGKTTLFGHTFEVSKCNPERGTKDDITVWMDLKEAQTLLQKPGLINAIFALSCHCEGDRLATIRREVSRVLPDTQVIEFASQAVTRAEARDRAAAAAKAALESETRHRADMRAERERMASIFVPVALVGCMVWIALLAFGNVRQRRYEIGVLRALGVRSRQVLTLFLSRAFLIGLVGAVVGYPVGVMVGSLSGGGAVRSPWDPAIFDAGMFVGLLLLTPLLAVLASCAPAVQAAEQDPAVVLAEE